MQFQIMGPLEVRERERGLPLGGRRQRTILAHLLIRPNQLVATDRLVVDVWGESPPETARSTLQSYISRLRKVLGAERIEGRSQAYILRADPEEVDALRFERMVAEGRRLLPTDPDAAARTLRGALSLWRGDALADLADNAALSSAIARLEELRMTAFEDRIAAELAGGCHVDVVPEVEAALAAEPLRERLWEQLMVGLYRSGRRADALAAFGRVRRVLAEELGIDPSPKLAALHEGILTQDPTLSLASSVPEGQTMSQPTDGKEAAPSVPPRSAEERQPATAGGRSKEVLEDAIGVEPPAEERRIVTVLFAAITASSELASSLDPEDLLGALQPFFAAMADEIERFGGTVEKYIGNDAVAVFGFPVAHEDDPVRALRAGLSVQQRLEALNRERFAERGLELSIRVGISTGEVIAATGARAGEKMVAGESVNVAARLEAEAPPGAILVGERTYRSTRDGFDYQPLGELAVKGLPHPVAAWELLGERTPPPAGPLDRPGFVGRDSEIGLLRYVFTRTVQERRPVLVTVVAPAGVGKSRLAREFTEALRAEHLQVEVVTGRCLPYGDGLTYWPLAEILKADAGILDSDPPEAILEKATTRVEGRSDGDEEGISRVLLASIGVPVRPDPLSGVDAGVARELIGRAWRRYLESMSAEKPVLAIVEDLHWADQGLLDLLEDVMVRMAGPLLLLCLIRPELFDRRPAWGGGVADANTVFLSPLSEEESRVLLEHLLGPGMVPAEDLAPLLARAEGNPFFLEELVQMLIDQGSLVRRGGTWALERALPRSLPDTIQGVIASRMDLLPRREKQAMQDAAVVGRTFWLGALEQLELADPGAAVDGLFRKGLVREAPRSTIAGDREYSFSHVLIRDVAYASIPKARRARAHAQVGTWIEGVTAGRLEEFAEILTHHFEQADDPGRTARFATLAGHRKRRLFAVAEAIGWYARALAATDRLPRPIAAPLIAEAALSRGKAEEMLSRFPEAEADYRRAIAAAQQAADSRIEAEALAALAHLYRATARYDEGRPILDEALEQARSVGATDLLVRILYTAGAVAFDRAQWEESIAFQEQALDLAVSEGDPEGEAFALHGLCDTRFFVGPFRSALTHALRSSELFRSLGQRSMLFHNGFMVGNLQWTLGEYAAAHDTFERCVAGSKNLGDRWVEALARSSRAHLRLSQGRLGAALSNAEESLAVLEGVGSAHVRLVALSFGLLSVLPELRAFGRLDAVLDEAWAVSDELDSAFMRPRLRALRAWLDVRAGRTAEGREGFQRADLDCGIAVWERLACARYELLAWEEVRSAAVEAAASRLCELAAQESPPLLAWGEYGLALAAALRGRWDEAQERSLGALARSEAIGEHPLIWRTARLAAASLSAVGRQQEAEERSQQAVDTMRAMADDLRDPGLVARFLEPPDVIHDT